MSNIFVKIGIGVADFGKWLAKAVTDTVKLAVKVETVLKAEEPLAAPFISGISTVISDVEALIAASGTALTAEGLNVPADSKVYQEMVTLISDFKKLAPVVEEAVSILEGKPTIATAPATTTTVTTATAATTTATAAAK